MTYKEKFLKYIFKIKQIGGSVYRGDTASREYEFPHTTIYEFRDRRNLLDDFYDVDLYDYGDSIESKFNPDSFDYNDNNLFFERFGFNIRFDNFEELKDFINREIFKQYDLFDGVIQFFEEKIPKKSFEQRPLPKFIVKKKYGMILDNTKTAQELLSEISLRENVNISYIKIYKTAMNGFPSLPISDPGSILSAGQKISILIMENENDNNQNIAPQIASDFFCIVDFRREDPSGTTIIIILDGKAYYIIADV
jgi:hypothetical protein